MSDLQTIFDCCADFDPSGDFEAFLKAVPAKWVIYLFADAHNQPVQLLCVKNLRSSLKRRLGSEEELIGASRRVNYRELVRRIWWRRVDSTFEADIIYHDAARQLFPQTYQGMVGFRPAWFVHVDPEATFPRYVKTIDLSNKAGMFVGPVEDKHAAARLIELVEDAFDLCRYHNILTESPHGKACAYKEMGKCPAPCDGSISMEAYRQLVALSLSTLLDPQDAIRAQTRRMQAAAAELQFELAGKIKTYIEHLSHLGKGPFRHVRALEQCCFLSFQRGPREGQAKLFLVTPGHIEQIAGLIDEPARPGELLRLTLERAAERPRGPVDAHGAERIGVVAYHLFAPRQTQGIFLPLDIIDEKSIAKAYRDLLKQKPQDQPEDEGVLKELQAM